MVGCDFDHGCCGTVINKWEPGGAPWTRLGRIEAKDESPVSLILEALPVAGGSMHKKLESREFGSSTVEYSVVFV